MTLRSRMMIAFAYLLLLAVVALSIPLAIISARQARSDFAIQLTEQAEVVAAEVPRVRGDGSEALRQLAEDYRRDGRVVIIDTEGTSIAMSGAQTTLGDNYLNYPVRQALHGRATRMVRDYPAAGMQYVATVPVIDDGRVIGAVLVNQPVAGVEQGVRQRVQYLAAVSLAILLVGLLVAALLARSLSKPLRALADVAQEIGDGNLEARAPYTAQPEVAEVGSALNTMTARIEQSLTAQTDFVANASHQLRTPLTGLRLRLEALQQQGAAGADEALAEIDRLAALIDDLLMLVRVGTPPLAPESTDLAAVAGSAVNRWGEQGARSDHVLGLEGADSPVHVAASAGDLAIILDNLIENALKYTPAGTTVSVSLDRLASDEDDGERVVLEVSDDGPGIAPQDRSRAFERFYRGASGAPVPGTGLGLAIVRQIAERWGGDAELVSDGGTSFRIYLPPANPPVPAVEQPAGVTSSVR